MACFDDFITYRGSGITPTSGLYVNDLYGVYFTKADAIANTDYATGIDFIESLIDRSANLVSAELRRYAMPYFKLNAVIAHYLGGEFDDGLGYHTAAAGRGIRLDIKETTLSEMYINRVTILANTSVVCNIVVTDGEDTENYAVTLVAGIEQDVEINYRCNRKRVYVTCDGIIAGAEGKARMDNCMEGYNILSVRGYDGSNLTSSHYGLRADVSVVCSMDNLACLLKDVLGEAVLYRFGMELAREQLESDRINYFTLTNRDAVIELLESYKEDYAKTMMDIARTIPKLLRKLDDYCIDCVQNKYIEVVP